MSKLLLISLGVVCLLGGAVYVSAQPNSERNLADGPCPDSLPVTRKDTGGYLDTAAGYVELTFAKGTSQQEIMQLLAREGMCHRLADEEIQQPNYFLKVDRKAYAGPELFVASLEETGIFTSISSPYSSQFYGADGGAVSVVSGHTQADADAYLAQHPEITVVRSTGEYRTQRYRLYVGDGNEEKALRRLSREPSLVYSQRWNLPAPPIMD